MGFLDLFRLTQHIDHYKGDLSAFGEMQILKYDDDTGKNYIVERIINKYTVKKYDNTEETTFEFNSEDDWRRSAIKRAKEIGADSVSYYHMRCDPYGGSERRVKIWSKQ